MLQITISQDAQQTVGFYAVTNHTAGCSHYFTTAVEFCTLKEQMFAQQLPFALRPEQFDVVAAIQGEVLRATVPESGRISIKNATFVFSIVEPPETQTIALDQILMRGCASIKYNLYLVLEGNRSFAAFRFQNVRGQDGAMTLCVRMQHYYRSQVATYKLCAQFNDVMFQIGEFKISYERQPDCSVYPLWVSITACYPACFDDLGSASDFKVVKLENQIQQIALQKPGEYRTAPVNLSALVYKDAPRDAALTHQGAFSQHQTILEALKLMPATDEVGFAQAFFESGERLLLRLEPADDAAISALNVKPQIAGLRSTLRDQNESTFVAAVNASAAPAQLPAYLFSRKLVIGVLYDYEQGCEEIGRGKMETEAVLLALVQSQREQRDLFLWFPMHVRGRASRICLCLQGFPGSVMLAACSGQTLLASFAEREFSTPYDAKSNPSPGMQKSASLRAEEVRIPEQNQISQSVLDRLRRSIFQGAFQRSGTLPSPSMLGGLMRAKCKALDASPVMQVQEIKSDPGKKAAVPAEVKAPTPQVMPIPPVPQALPAKKEIKSHYKSPMESCGKKEQCTLKPVWSQTPQMTVKLPCPLRSASTVPKRSGAAQKPGRAL